MKMKMKTVYYLLLGLCLAMAACESEMQQNEITNGTCGKNLTWHYDKTKATLTISGTGEMEECQSRYDIPWASYTKSIQSVIIENGVTSIGYWAFSECSLLAQITIPNSVTHIGKGAFWWCSALTAINIENGNTVYCSESGVLFNIDKTTLIQYPEGKTDTVYTIPNSVTSIEDWAFADCSALKQIIIPNSVANIEDHAFYGTALYDDSKNWKNNVLYIDAWLIKAKETVSREYNIKAGTKAIADKAFHNCSKLTQVTLPNSVTIIGKEAFYGCSALTEMTVSSTVPPMVGSNAFEEVKRDIPVYVPAEVLAAYKAAEGWKKFTNLQAIQ